MIIQTWDFKTLTVDYNPKSFSTLFEYTLSFLAERLGISESKFQIFQNNRPISESSQIDINSQFLRVSLKNGFLKGGKGGFGSLLRSMNPKKQPTENFEACRDLSGRRLRTINNEARLEEWK